MNENDNILMQEIIVRIKSLLDMGDIASISTNIASKTISQLDINSILAPLYPQFNFILTLNDAINVLTLIKIVG
jgi:hypothetical protein